MNGFTRCRNFCPAICTARADFQTVCDSSHRQSTISTPHHHKAKIANRNNTANNSLCNAHVVITNSKQQRSPCNTPNKSSSGKLRMNARYVERIAPQVKSKHTVSCSNAKDHCLLQSSVEVDCANYGFDKHDNF
jgi:hypothetical protein